MDLDGPKKSESMSMDVDVDDGVVPGRNTDSPCPPGAWRSSHPLPPTDYETPPGLNAPLPFAMLFSSTPEEVGDAGWHRGEEQHSLFSSNPSAPERKRKHDDEDEDGEARPTAEGSSTRRTRRRLQTYDGEFPPLIFIPREPARRPSAEEHVEETLSAAHATRAFHVLDHHHHHGPRILPPSASPGPERRRSDSAGSFAEVALAKPGRLSTLQDIWLPPPFEDVPDGVVVVHERGLDAGPVFLPTRAGRSGGSLVPHAPLAGSAMPVLAQGLTKYFDKPLCESPESISPVEDDGSR